MKKLTFKRTMVSLMVVMLFALMSGASVFAEAAPAKKDPAGLMTAKAAVERAKANLDAAKAAAVKPAKAYKYAQVDFEKAEDAYNDLVAKNKEAEAAKQAAEKAVEDYKAAVKAENDLKFKINDKKVEIKSLEDQLKNATLSAARKEELKTQKEEAEKALENFRTERAKAAEAKKEVEKKMEEAKDNAAAKQPEDLTAADKAMKEAAAARDAAKKVMDEANAKVAVAQKLYDDALANLAMYNPQGSKPQVSKDTTKKSGKPATGDSTSFVLYGLLLSMSLVGGAVAYRKVKADR